MKCPRCHASLADDIPSRCPHCDADLGAVQELALLRSGLQQTADLAGQTVASLTDLHERLARLEERLAAPAEAAAKAEATPETAAETPQETPAAESPAEEEQPEQHTEAETPKPRPTTPLFDPIPATAPQPGEFETRFGQKVLLIAGLAITVLGIGYFLKYAFDRDWVGPAGRVAMSYLWGMAFLGGGEWLRRRWRPFGLSIIGGGIAVLYLSSWAAFQRYDLISQSAAFGFMALTTALACTLSVIHDNKWLAVLGLVGGFASPFLVSTGTDNQIFLMTYISILNSGVLAVGFAKRWRLLTYLGFFFTWILMFAWMGEWYADEKFWPTLIFANIFFIIYSIAPLAFYIRDGSKPGMGDLGLVIPNSYIGLGLCVGLINDYSSLEPSAIASLAYAAVFLGFGMYIRRRLADHRAMLLMLGQALVFLAATVPLLFSQHWITVLWAVQTMVLVWLAPRLESKGLRWCAVILGLITVDKFILYDLWEVFDFSLGDFSFDSGYGYRIASRYLTHIAMLAMLFALGRDNGKKSSYRELSIVFRFGFAALLVWVLNMEVAGLFNEYLPRATFAAISVLWTLIAITLMVFGFMRQLSWLRHLALAAFGLTILKVFFADMANVSTPFRIVSFMVLGLVLIGASFLYHKYKHLLLPEEEPSAQSPEQPLHSPKDES